MTPLHLMVAGLPDLADRMAACGQFQQVHRSASMAQLRDALAPLRTLPREQVAFIFSDTLTADIENLTLVSLISKLSNAGYPVVIVAQSPRAVEIVRANPSAGLLDIPVTVNSALAALHGLVPDAGLQRHPEGDIEVPLGAAYPANDVVAPKFAAPTAPAAPRTPATPSPQFTPPAFGAPSPQAPVVPAFGTPAPQAPATPAFGTPAPQAPAIPAFATPPVQGTPQPADPFARPKLDQAPPAAPVFSAPAFAPPAPDTPYAGASNAPSTPLSGPVSRLGYEAVMPKASRRGYVMSIAVPKGGAGKSTLTLNLAAFMGAVMRAHGKKVCVVDANVQQSDISKYIKKYEPNIIDLVQNQQLLSEDQILQGLVHRDDLNMSFLLGPATPDEANPEWVTPQLYAEIVRLLRKHYDYIFIDTPVAEKYHSLFRDFVLARSDYLIVPVNPNIATLLNTQNWLSSAVVAPAHQEGAGFAPEKVGIVLNRAKDNIDCSVEDVRANLSMWQFIGSVPETDEWQRANNRYQLVANMNYSELNEAFAEVLYRATGEEAMIAHMTAGAASNENLLDRIRGALRLGR
jgi:cellulose biosynthesis protein BcsQ